MSKVVSFSPRYASPIGEPEGFRSLSERQAMQEGLSGLMEILSWARPHGSDAELDFMRDYLLPAIRGLGYRPDIDGFGNIWVSKSRCDIEVPVILWSCHVDTVHAKGGRQRVQFGEDGRTIELVKRKPGRCLGADDGAGVWLLLQMLEAGVPGGYVFHRGEEKGRLGSEYVATSEPERLKPYDACVAFDRRDYADLITHQMGMRCASEAFASTLSGVLNTSGFELKYRPDDGGSYTDSYSYAEIISECANVSVGYDREHGPNETLNGLHVWRLREALLGADLSKVICERDPSDMSYDCWGYGVPYGSDYKASPVQPRSRTGMDAWRGEDTTPDEERETLIDIIRRYPRAVADLLGVYGFGAEELMEHMTDSEIAGAMPLVAGVGMAGGWSHG